MGWRGFLVVVMMAGLLGGCGGERADAPAQPASPTAPTATPPAKTPAQRTCPVCKQPVPAEAKYCRACGSRQP